MPHPKPSHPVEPTSRSPRSGFTPGRSAVLALLALVLVAAALGAGGLWQDLFAGPKIPLPRQNGPLTLGMPEAQVAQLLPGSRKKLRPFNNDPDFKIADLTSADGLPTGWSTLSLLYYQGRLYYLSVMWNGDAAQALPFDQWVRQYRRWDRGPQGHQTQSMGAQITLEEWHFTDGSTEMTLRNLGYDGKTQRWQDLRDSSDAAAQAAFSKYRLDGGAR
ncbi:MAG TPA: hypothetical protein VFR02_09970 [bacterium]|nr:hypothetical protein [bacterium]